MLSIILLTILSLTQLSPDTVEVKGTNGISYRLFANQNKLCFQYKAGRNWSEPSKLDSGDISEYKVAISPGDYLHVVWRKANRIYYIYTRFPVYPDAIRQHVQPVWSTIVPISTPQYPTTEPASNPFVEAQGELVYVIWRGPYDEYNPTGEIWQRRGQIRPPQLPEWEPTPRNVSYTPDRESNFPTMSTGYTVVWQESVPGDPPNVLPNYEIYGDITGVGDNINLSQTGKNSCYPHTNLLPAPPESQEDWRLFTIWTEESIVDTFYKVKYDDYYFSEPDTNIWPLSITGGDSTPSPYCLERDGFIQFNGMNIDYDTTSLAYILPYLNPRKHYLLEAIAYHESSGVYRESFTFKNRSFEVRLRHAIPETLRVIIPPGLYDSTFLSLRINRVQGNFASLAKLRLFEFEMPLKEKGGPQSEIVTQMPLKSSLFSPYPNPFSNDLRIRYQLAKAGIVSIKIYDISGRELRILTKENK